MRKKSQKWISLWRESPQWFQNYHGILAKPYLQEYKLYLCYYYLSVDIYCPKIIILMVNIGYLFIIFSQYTGYRFLNSREDLLLAELYRNMGYTLPPLTARCYDLP